MSHQLGEMGSGSGKGGGGGGSIRAAGGAFGKMEAAHEEEYFYKKVRVLLLTDHKIALADDSIEWQKKNEIALLIILYCRIGIRYNLLLVCGAINWCYETDI